MSVMLVRISSSGTDSLKPFPPAVVGQAAEAGFSRDGDVPSAPSHKDLGAPRARDGPLEGVHVAHDVQKLSQPPCQLGPSASCL